MLAKVKQFVPNDILVIDSDSSRALSFQRYLEFINLKSDIKTPDEVVDLELSDLDQYVSIFTVNDDDVNSFFLDLNQKTKHQLPVVLLSEQDPFNSQKVSLHLPYIAASSFEPDYLSIKRVMEQVKTHNIREGRVASKSCQNLIGVSPQIAEINRMIEQVADTTASVMILGDSGTGKEVIARNIHAQSSRSNKPFVPINCGAIPSDLLESELFGHDKGAFTGAISSRQGRFELAEGGVIFLDEIGDMPLAMQVKLLRVLQERTYERVGSNQSNKTDVRVIAATHRRLEDLITEGKFREDLYYRLNVFPIEVPALSERREDIPLLISELINRIESDQRGSVRLSRKAVNMLSQYDWPGNVRELGNLIERLAILYPHDLVDTKDLPEKFILEGTEIPDLATASNNEIATQQGGGSSLLIPEEGIDMKQYLVDIEVSLIEQALNETNSVVARAAKLLQMRRTTLVEKMRKYELSK